jgi:hypothetical protein
VDEVEAAFRPVSPASKPTCSHRSKTTGIPDWFLGRVVCHPQTEPAGLSVAYHSCDSSELLVPAVRLESQTKEAAKPSCSVLNRSSLQLKSLSMQIKRQKYELHTAAEIIGP